MAEAREARASRLIKRRVPHALKVRFAEVDSPWVSWGTTVSPGCAMRLGALSTTMCKPTKGFILSPWFAKLSTMSLVDQFTCLKSTWSEADKSLISLRIKKELPSTLIHTRNPWKSIYRIAVNNQPALKRSRINFLLAHGHLAHRLMMCSIHHTA